MKTEPAVNESKPGGGRRKLARNMIVQLILLATAAALAWPHVDVDRIVGALGALPAPIVALFLVCMLGVRPVDSWRWRLVLSRLTDRSVPSLWFMLRVTLLAQFTNIWFPSFLGGEGVKVWKMSSESGFSSSIPLSILLDRAIGLLGLGLIAGSALLFFPRLTAGLETSLDLTHLFVGSAVIVIGLTVAAAWRGATLTAAAKSIWKHLKLHNFLAAPFGVSLLGNLLVCLAYGTLLSSLLDVTVGLVVAVAMVPRLGRVVPISALGIGAVEGGTIVVGGLLGLPGETLAVVVSLHVASKYLAAFLGFVLEALYGGLSPLKVLVRGGQTAPANAGDHEGWA